jgi:hypothetical protein
MQIPVHHKAFETKENFESPMKEETEEQLEFMEKVKESFKESTDDQRKVLQKEKLSPVPFLLMAIFILWVIIFSLASKDTFIQDNFDLRQQLYSESKMACDNNAKRNIAYHSGGVRLANRGIKTYGTIFVCHEYNEEYVSGEIISSPTK